MHAYIILYKRQSITQYIRCFLREKRHLNINKPQLEFWINVIFKCMIVVYWIVLSGSTLWSKLATPDCVWWPQISTCFLWNPIRSSCCTWNSKIGLCPLHWLAAKIKTKSFPLGLLLQWSKLELWLHSCHGSKAPTSSDLLYCTDRHLNTWSPSKLLLFIWRSGGVMKAEKCYTCILKYRFDICKW